MRAPRRSTIPRRRPRERGASLILAVLLFVTIFGIAALTIDLGFARLTQDEMQTAADAASLEGLRALASGGDAQGTANALVTRNYTDLSDATVQGQGPAIGLDAGLTEIHASETLTIPGVGVYSPQTLEPVSTLPEGDLVSGSITDTTGLAASAPELVDFTIAGFTTPSTTPISPTALLARLRRTAPVLDPSLPGPDNEPGVSSSLPAVPFLFGHGAFIHGAGADADFTTYSPLRDGIKVRATAIATLQPAMAVGWQSGGAASVGAAHFTIPDTAWTGGPVTVTLATPALTYPSSGSFYILPAVNSPMVGATVAGNAVPPPVIETTNPPGYVPLYRPLASGRLAIVGFVYAQWTLTIDANGDGSVVLTPQTSVTGPNASAVVWDGFAGAASAEVQEVLTAQRSIAAPVLQAPALAR